MAICENFFGKLPFGLFANILIHEISHYTVYTDQILASQRLASVHFTHTYTYISMFYTIFWNQGAHILFGKHGLLCLYSSLDVVTYTKGI